MLLAMVHEELNQARIAQKQTAQSLELKERKKLFDGLKGSKYTLLKSESQLSIQQQERLKQVKEASPLLGIMHSLKEEFNQLFERNTEVGQGVLELIDWLKKIQTLLQKKCENNPTLVR